MVTTARSASALPQEVDTFRTGKACCPAAPRLDPGRVPPVVLCTDDMDSRKDTTVRPRIARVLTRLQAPLLVSVISGFQCSVPESSASSGEMTRFFASLGE